MSCEAAFLSGILALKFFFLFFFISQHVIPGGLKWHSAAFAMFDSALLTVLQDYPRSCNLNSYCRSMVKWVSL